MQTETTTTQTIIPRLSAMSKGELKRTARALFDMVTILSEDGKRAIANEYRARLAMIEAELAVR